MEGNKLERQKVKTREKNILSTLGIEETAVEKCKVLRNVVIRGTGVICSDLKLTELILSLAKNGIIIEKMYGGAFPVAFGEKTAIEFLIRQWKFFCDHVPDISKIDTVFFTTHDECLYANTDPREALKIAIENFGQFIVEPLGGRLTKAVGFHLAFEKNEIVANKVAAKSF